MRVDHSALVVSLAQTRKHEDDEDDGSDQREEREDDQNNSNRVEGSFHVLPILKRVTLVLASRIERVGAVSVVSHTVFVSDNKTQVLRR